MPKLTKSVVDSSVPKEKDYIVWDIEIKGFGCRVFPGGKKTYVFHYRAPITKKYSYVKIGVHGNLTVDEARGKAKGLAFSVSSGVDIKEQRKQEIIEEQKSMLFSEFMDMFINKHIKATYKPTTIERSFHQIKNHILPFFGQKRINEISQQDIIRFSEKLSYIKATSNSCVTLLSSAFSKAEIWGLMPRNSNPCLKVPKYPDKKKERFLTNDELQRLEDILIARTIDSKSSPYTLASLWMLLYTGCRESEVLTLKWKDVHLDDGYLYLEDSKVGVRTIPLNEKAKVVIRSLEKKESNPYVFCGGIPGQHLKETKTTWRKVRKLAGISDVRLHDLRHSFASFALKKGVDLYTVSKLLGHKNIKTTTRYAHLELDHLKKATNIVAEVFK
jgi:integrase